LNDFGAGWFPARGRREPKENPSAIRQRDNSGVQQMKIKVLLVDDEREFTEILAERLETRDFEVMKAFSGDEAIGILKERKADVVVLDVSMPGRDGIEILQEIKQMNPIIEVIMLTGHATVGTAVEGMKLGAFDYLMKPTETKDLVEKIARAFKRKSEQESRIRDAEINRIMSSRWG
jgi:two-component system, OmpR family, response regulator CpxR